MRWAVVAFTSAQPVKSSDYSSTNSPERYTRDCDLSIYRSKNRNLPCCRQKLFTGCKVMDSFTSRINDMSPCWSCGCKYDSHLDFLVWVLEIDGLQTSTYYQHSDGDHSLRTQGLTLEAWELWMTEYILSHYHTHPTLINNPINLKYQQDYDASFYGYMRQIGKEENFSPNIVEGSIVKHQQKRAAERRTILEESTRFYGDKPLASPGAIPVPSQAEPRLIERIHELWAVFRNGISIQRSQQWDCLLYSSSPDYQPEFMGEDGRADDLYRQLKPYHSQLRGFVLYLISYPYTTRYSEAPISSLISLSAESRTRRVFYDQAKQAASDLVELNRSV
jgi:hypothetical protein